MSISAPRFTSADLEHMSDDGKRYEIIDGELIESKQPDWHHQLASGQLFAVLQAWNVQTKLGVANIAPGLVFVDDDDTTMSG